MPAFDPSDIRSLEDAFWAALAGPALPGQRRAMLSRLLSSPEFNTIRLSWKDARAGGHTDRAPDAPGSDEGFVRVAYECLLGRPADEGGLRHYVAALAAGETRAGVLWAL